MKTKKKLNTKRTLKRRLTKKIGGLLRVSEESDLINTHLCNIKMGSEKEKTGLEILTSISKSFQLNEATLGYLQQMYKNIDNKWFKFVIFNNSDEIYIYIIDGAKINKHSVCMIQGLLDVTNKDGEYQELRDAFNNLNLFKNEYGSNMEAMSIEEKNECTTLMNTVDELIERDIKCMPVIAAGSGSVNPDNSICINNKSGHYKPTEASMLEAKKVFEEKTKARVFVKEKEDKILLKERYGKNAENYSGICL